MATGFSSKNLCKKKDSEAQNISHKKKKKSRKKQQQQQKTTCDAALLLGNEESKRKQGLRYSCWALLCPRCSVLSEPRGSHKEILAGDVSNPALALLLLQPNPRASPSVPWLAANPNGRFQVQFVRKRFAAALSEFCTCRRFLKGSFIRLGRNTTGISHR